LEDEAAMKHIAIFQCDLRVGGIQKSLVNILNEIDYGEYTVDLYLFDKDCFFSLPEREGLNVYFEKPYFFLNRLVYFGLLRRLAPVYGKGREYDVAIDFNSYRNECAVGALGVKAKKRVMWIHNDVEIKRRNEIKYRILWHFFKSKFKYYDEFAAVSPGIIDGFRRETSITDKRITAIPNRINTAEIFEKSREAIDFDVSPEVYNLCTMGHIAHQKGFDILMDYMAEVVRQRQDIHLYLLGDGPDREKIARQVTRLGLDSFVSLLGNKSNPFPYLEKMDGFVLTSRYEGQGMVIWEAKTLGLELFITKNLEKYNPDIAGREDIVSALVRAERHEKQRDDLAGYNAAISASLKKVLEC